MDDSKRSGPDDAARVRADKDAILDAPVSVAEMPGRGWRAEQAGMVGVGDTRDDAIRDLAGKVWIAFSRVGEPPL